MSLLPLEKSTMVRVVLKSTMVRVVLRVLVTFSCLQLYLCCILILAISFSFFKGRCNLIFSKNPASDTLDINTVQYNGIR